MRLLPTGLCAILTFLGLVSLAQAQDSSLVALASELPSCVVSWFVAVVEGQPWRRYLVQVVPALDIAGSRKQASKQTNADR